MYKTKTAPRNRLKKQRTIAKHNTSLAIFLALSAFIAIGLIGHSDYQYAKFQDASNACQSQMYNTMPTFEQCINNQLERNNDK